MERGRAGRSSAPAVERYPTFAPLLLSTLAFRFAVGIAQEKVPQKYLTSALTCDEVGADTSWRVLMAQTLVNPSTGNSAGYDLRR
jgi:hypothetical protein